MKYSNRYPIRWASAVLLQSQSPQLQPNGSTTGFSQPDLSDQPDRSYRINEDQARSRAIVKKIDTMPGGSAIFADMMLNLNNSPAFDLADAPDFTRQLRLAGIDPDSLSVLPRLSKLGEASP